MSKWDEMVAKFFEAIIFWDWDAMAEAKKLAKEYEQEQKEETESEINARFLRGKQDEIDNLKKEAERQKWKAEKYSNAFCEEMEKRKEAEAYQRKAERIAEHQEDLITKALELLEYVWMSDTKKIELLTNVIKQDRWYIKERNDDTVNFRFGNFRNKRWPEWQTWISN